MSKKKGQKSRHDPVIPMNLKQLFRLSPIERKAIARKIKLKSGARVWWDELAMDNAESESEKLKGVGVTREDGGVLGEDGYVRYPGREAPWF